MSCFGPLSFSSSGSFFVAVEFAFASSRIVFHSMLVEHGGKEAHHRFVTPEFSFQRVDDTGVLCREFDEVVKPGGLLLDGISHLFQSPLLYVDDLGFAFGQHLLEFLDSILCLVIRQNGIENEYCLVVVHGLIICYKWAAKVYNGFGTAKMN